MTTPVGNAQQLIRAAANRRGYASADSAEKRQQILHDAAREVMIHHRALVDEVMDRIGTWPSSEPELAALQRIYR